MRLTIVNLVISGANGGGMERSASILARNVRKMNPPYAGRRIAAEATYKDGAVEVARWSFCRPCESRDPYAVPYLRARRETPSATIRAGVYGSLLSQGRRSHRHFAVPHWCAGGQRFRRVDDGVGVDAVVTVEVVDRAGLAELLDAERFDAMAAHTAEPAQCRGMAVDHSDDAALARQRRQHFFDIAEMGHASAGAPPLYLPAPAPKPPRRQRGRHDAHLPLPFA